MTHQQLEVLRALRKESYAVVVFTPEELEGVSASNIRLVEDRMIERGWDAIEALREGPA